MLITKLKGDTLKKNASEVFPRLTSSGAGPNSEVGRRGGRGGLGAGGPSQLGRAKPGHSWGGRVNQGTQLPELLAEGGLPSLRRNAPS